MLQTRMLVKKTDLGKCQMDLLLAGIVWLHRGKKLKTNETYQKQPANKLFHTGISNYVWIGLHRNIQFI